LVWKITQITAFNIRDGGDAKKWVQESSESTEKLVDPESTKKSSPSQESRRKWKDTIIVSAWSKLQAIAKKERNTTIGRVAW